MRGFRPHPFRILANKQSGPADLLLQRGVFLRVIDVDPIPEHRDGLAEPIGLG